MKTPTVEHPKEGLAMAMRTSKQDEVEVSPSTRPPHREEAVDVFAEALWALWLRHQSKQKSHVQTSQQVENGHG